MTKIIVLSPESLPKDSFIIISENSPSVFKETSFGFFQCYCRQITWCFQFDFCIPNESNSILSEAKCHEQNLLKPLALHRSYTGWHWNHGRTFQPHRSMYVRCTIDVFVMTSGLNGTDVSLLRAHTSSPMIRFSGFSHFFFGLP